MNAVEPDGYLSLVQLARYAGMSIRTLRTHLRDPEHPLPCFKPGGKVLVKRSEFDAWMSEHHRHGQSTDVAAIVADVFRGL